MNDVKLVCFDMDDTLISQNSWYRLNIALGVTEDEDQEMYDAYERGEITYDQWMNQLVDLYKERGKATRDTISNTLCKFEFNSGAEVLVEYLKSKKYELAIISGSFDMLVTQVADTLGIKHRKANTSFAFDHENYLQGVISGGDERRAKLEHLKTFCSELGISIDQCACIGDRANNIEMFKETGLGITFEDAPQHVREAAWKVVSGLAQVKEVL